MLSPALFVGCGGSGLRTLRELRRELENRLAAVGISPEQFPDAWQFVAVDVPSVEEQNPLRSYAHDSYVGLAPDGVSYGFKNGVDDQLSRRANVQDDYAQWRPNPDEVHVNIATGAGQFRAVGRVVTAFAINDTVVPALRRATDALSTDEARVQLDVVSERFGFPKQPGEESNPPVAILVSSLAGGAGSGTFIDVADALRRMSAGEKWLQDSIGILFDPTIFSDQQHFHRQGLAPNALAAVSELVAGHWNPWQEFPYLPSLSAPAGDKRGPMYPMLFGLSNGTVNLPNAGAAYTMVADILANLTLGAEAASSFRQSLMGNWGNYSQVANQAPMLHHHDSTKLIRPLSSIGFSRVSLGRDRFTRYASERMTRDLVKGLLTKHRDAAVEDGTKDEDQLIAELIGPGLDGDLVREFLMECGLHEGTEKDKKDQVIDALYDEAQVNAQIAVAQEYVRKKVSVPRDIGLQIGNCFKAEDKTKPINLSSQSGRKRYDAEALRPAIIRRVRPWADQVQITILDTVTKWVALHGLPVTIAVVREAVGALGKTFPDDLRREANQMQEGPVTTVGLLAELAKVNIRRGLIPGALWNSTIDPWVAELVKGIDARYRREIAAGLLVDLSWNLMKPILDALSESLAALRSDYTSPNFALLSDGSVPEALRPAKNVQLVDPVDSYPEKYLELIIATSGSPDEALLRAFCGESIEDRRRSTLSRFDQAWTTEGLWAPDLSALGGASVATPARLKPSFGFALSAIKSRCAQWLKCDPGNAVGAYVSEHLNSYLKDGTATARAERANRFASLLASAITAAQPFVDLDPAWMSKFSYEVNKGLSYSTSKIPISKSADTKAFSAVDSVAKQFAPNDSQREAIYDNQYTGDVEIFCNRYPFPPSGALSLTGPIVGSYQVAATGSSDGGGMTGFWTQRRSRPLLQAIPLSKGAQLAVTRGWITALLLDLIVQDETQGTCAIADGQRKRLLLSPPIGNPKEGWDWLGMAMESALLSEMLMDQNEGFDTLQFIAGLGCSGNETAITNDYSRPNAALNSMTPAGLANLSTSADSPPADVAEALKGLVDAFGGLQVGTGSSYEPVSYAIQLAPLIVEAAEQILSKVDLIGTGGNMKSIIPGAKLKVTDS